MLYKFFTNSQRAWQAMFQAMEEAQESIYLEMYIFIDDMHEFNFLNLLKEKAKSGVRVKIILDSFGSADLAKKTIADLKDAGAELIFFSSFLHRTHRKILILDEKIAFIGGVNFYQNTKKWADLVVRVKGVLVHSIVASFAKAYALAGGKDKTLLVLEKKMILHKTKTWLMEHFPIQNKFSLKRIYKESLRDAERNVILITPYFVPRHWLVGAMHQAALRGVKVEVLIPRMTDNFLVDRINYFYMSKLAKLGIVFYIGSKMNHAKVLIVDEKEGMIGSPNLDPLSFDFNSEIGVFLKDVEAIHKLLTIINHWKKEAVLFDPKTYKPMWTDYILLPLMRLLFFI